MTKKTAVLMAAAVVGYIAFRQWNARRATGGGPVYGGMLTGFWGQS